MLVHEFFIIINNDFKKIVRKIIIFICTLRANKKRLEIKLYFLYIHLSILN